MAPKSSISRPIFGLPTKKTLGQRLALQLYERTRAWQDDVDGSPLPSPSSSSLQTVTVVCLSDTHNTQPSAVPDGDILVHAGDLSQYGTFPELAAQLAWLRKLPHRHKIFIAGNHDLSLDRAFVEAHPDRELVGGPHRKHNYHSASDLDWGDITYLEHSAVDVVVRGRCVVRLFGSPWTPRFGSWAFQYGAEPSGKPNSKQKSPWDGAVPDGTDVVVSHGPPAGHCDDGGKGCESLLRELWRTRPALVVCGHIHTGRGATQLLYNNVQRYYEDAVLDGRARWKRWVSLGQLAVCVVWLAVQQALGRRTGAATRAGNTTQLVNAAAVSGRGNRNHHSPIVVTIDVASKESA